VSAPRDAPVGHALPPLCSRSYHIDMLATAERADQPLAPVEHSRFGVVSSKEDQRHLLASTVGGTIVTNFAASYARNWRDATYLNRIFRSALIFVVLTITALGTPANAITKSLQAGKTLLTQAENNIGRYIIPKIDEASSVANPKPALRSIRNQVDQLYRMIHKANQKISAKLLPETKTLLTQAEENIGRYIRPKLDEASAVPNPRDALREIKDQIDQLYRMIREANEKIS
jgi:hypothetical protein